MADINYTFGCVPTAFKVGDEVVLVEPFKIFRLLAGGRLDICDSEGNCISVRPNQVNLKTRNMKAMKDAVKAVADNLLKANNKVTTLEIKTELRRDYPYYFWDQQTVSDFMGQLAGDGVYDYDDNGTYREYRHSGTKPNPVTPVASKTVSQPVTLTGAIKTGFRPRKVTPAPVAVVTKKRGRPRKSRTINRAQALVLVTNPNFQSVTFGNGTIVNEKQIRDMKKSPKGYLTVSKLYKITEITAAGVTYQVK